MEADSALAQPWTWTMVLAGGRRASSFASSRSALEIPDALQRRRRLRGVAEQVGLVEADGFHAFRRQAGSTGAAAANTIGA